jgi:hypothetical protein
MGIFLVDKGGRLDREQFKDQLRVVLDNCGKKPKADGTTKEPTLLFSQRPDNLRAAKKAYRGYLGDGGEPFELLDRPAARKPRLFLLRANRAAARLWGVWAPAEPKKVHEVALSSGFPAGGRRRCNFVEGRRRSYVPTVRREA